MAKDTVPTESEPRYLRSSLSDVQFKLSCDAVLSKRTHFDSTSLTAILTQDDPSKPCIVLANDDKYFWYFAYGSMTNPISLYLRDLTPLISYPATCFNYQLVFRGTDGMADLKLSKSGDVDGVVHLMTSKDIGRLDAIEDVYHRIELTVVDYQNKIHRVYAYQMVIVQPLTLPTERYLDVIVKGCEYFSVRSSHIDRLKFDQLVVPRKSSRTYKSISDVPKDVFYTYEELARHNGSNPDLILWISINGKVLEYTGLPSIEDPDYKRQSAYYKFYQTEWGGGEIAYKFSKAIYEPLYKLPLHREDLCNEHRAMIEDNCIDWMDLNSISSCWKPIGRIRSELEPNRSD